MYLFLRHSVLSVKNVDFCQNVTCAIKNDTNYTYEKFHSINIPVAPVQNKLFLFPHMCRAVVPLPLGQ